jgi:DNA-binding SARP family transcriptional activator
VKVVDGDRVVPVLGAHAQLVLAMLAVERERTIAQDELAEVLWPTRVPRSWESMLRTAVSRVRASLASATPHTDSGARISTLNGCYRLDLPLDSSIDVHDATCMLDAAVSATLTGDDAAARDHAAAARRILARAFLPGLSAAWIENQRDGLGRALVQTLDVLSSAHTRLGESSAAVATAREAVALQPLREPSHRTLISAHVAAGNRAEGVRAYEACRTLLMDELGVQPAPETEALYSSLVGSVARESSVVPLPPPLPPMLMTEAPFGFVNRVRERSLLLRAAEAVRGGQCHLVLVSGEGGSGKSQLIAEIARRLAARRTAILYGRCTDSAEPNEPVIDCIRSWATALPDAALEKAVGPWTDALSRVAPELGTRLGRSAVQPPIVNGDAEDVPLSEAVAGLVQSLAACYPVVLIVEDLQWAGERTFAILRYLLASAPPRTLVVASYRSTETVIGDRLSTALAEIVCAGQQCTRVDVKGLGVIDVAELLGAALGGDLDESDLALAHRIHRETAGNPYLVERLIRHVVESGRSADPRSMDILAALEDPIRRRLGRLPADLSDYLLAAAVIGAEFEADDLHAAAGTGPEIGPQLAEQLVERGLLAAAGGQVGRLRFVHPIVREVLFRYVTSLRSHRVMHTYLDGRAAHSRAACG